jgi:hypothetical protein
VAGGLVVALGTADLVPDDVLDLWRGDPGGAGGDQVGLGDAERREVGQRQVDPAALQVLADVADEVGELEGQAEFAGGAGGGGPVGRLQDRQHHRADDGGRALHVLQQVVIGLVAVDGEVHAHRPEELLEVGSVQVEHGNGVQDGGQDLVVGLLAGQPAQEPRGPGLELPGALAWRGVADGGVDDLVAVAGEAVEGVDVAALPPRQQPGRQVVGAAVGAVQRAAALVGLRQPAVHPASPISTRQSTQNTTVRYRGHPVRMQEPAAEGRMIGGCVR